MATYRAATSFVPQFVDANGVPLSGGTISAFLAGTTTATSMFSNDAGTSAGAIVTLNALGSPEVSGNTVLLWVDADIDYKFVLKDSLGVSIWTVDDLSYTPSSDPYRFATVAGMVAATTLSVGNIVETAGYYAAADGGGNQYVIVAAATGTADGGRYINLASHQAQGVFPAGVNILQFGAKGDGTTDDLVGLQAAVTYGSNVYFPTGIYYITDKITLHSDLTVHGDGDSSVLLVTGAFPSGGSGIGHRIFHCEDISRFYIRNLKFDAGGETGFTTGQRCIWVDTCSDYSVKDCHFITPGGAVAQIKSSNYTISGNTISVASTDGTDHHDGVIDQWDGCNNFIVEGNTLNGAGIGSIAILTTAEDYDGAARNMYHFSIVDNHIKSFKDGGISLLGRTGRNTNFTVSGNIVEDITLFFGINISDSEQGTITGNTVDSVASIGMRLTKQISEGGLTGIQKCTITGNVVRNANLIGYTTTSGSAFYVDDTQRSVISNNVVAGSSQWNGISLLANVTTCQVFSNVSSGAVNVDFINTGTLNLCDHSGTGAPGYNDNAGSTYRRTDGGVGSSLYVKETATLATGWTPVLSGEGSIKSSSPTAGLGYATGAGGAATQLTSRTTGVTLNKVCGAITLFSAAGATAYTSFTVTNSAVAANDVIRVSVKSATNKYLVFVTAVASGSFEITFNTTVGTSVDSPVFSFSIIKAVAA
jgi:hypothetical protein